MELIKKQWDYAIVKMGKIFVVYQDDEVMASFSNLEGALEYFIDKCNEAEVKNNQ